jgi:hypothetical protein
LGTGPRRTSNPAAGPSAASQQGQTARVTSMAAGSEGMEVSLPTTQQLRALAIHAAVPMIGFGIMDQTIMIQAGDLIDSTLGSRLALPTLYAAACGQVGLIHPPPLFFPPILVVVAHELPGYSGVHKVVHRIVVRYELRSAAST